MFNKIRSYEIEEYTYDKYDNIILMVEKYYREDVDCHDIIIWLKHDASQNDKHYVIGGGFAGCDISIEEGFMNIVNMFNIDKRIDEIIKGSK